MGKRLSKIVTKTGDAGSSSIDGKERLQKFHPHFCLLGDLDELAAVIGIAKFYCKNIVAEKHPKLVWMISEELSAIAQDLFNLSGSIALKKNLLEASRIKNFESQIENFLKFIPPAEEFIVSEGREGGLYINYSRTIARKIERNWWHSDLAQESQYKELQHIGKYLNRLSDWLFIAMRIINSAQAQPETLWNNPTKTF